MTKKTLLTKFFLKFFKDLPYLNLNLNKPKIYNKNYIKIINERNFHFQYSFEMKTVNQDFKFPRYENMLVAQDILTNYNLTNSSNKKSLSLCESAPLDGYIVWRLSPLQKKSNLNLNILEIQKGNCEKIELISKVFNYKLNIFNDSLDKFNNGKFNYFTMLGVTYQLPNPINTFTHILNNLLLPGAIFYFDFIHPYENFKKYGFHDNGEVNLDGFIGRKYILADDRTKEDNEYFLNHPTSATSTLLFNKQEFKSLFKSKFKLNLIELYISVADTYEMVTYAVHLK
jgi:hypothetical protein